VIDNARNKEYKVDNFVPIDTASCHRNLESSWTVLGEVEISQVYCCPSQ